MDLILFCLLKKDQGVGWHSQAYVTDYRKIQDTCVCLRSGPRISLCISGNPSSQARIKECGFHEAVGSKIGRESNLLKTMGSNPSSHTKQFSPTQVPKPLSLAPGNNITALQDGNEYLAHGTWVSHSWSSSPFMTEKRLQNHPWVTQHAHWVVLC